MVNAQVLTTPGHALKPADSLIRGENMWSDLLQTKYLFWIPALLQASMPYALLANLRLFKIIPDDFVTGMTL